MRIDRAIRSLPPPVLVVCVAAFVNRVGTMALPFLVLYLTKERNYSPRTAGVVLAFYGAGAMLAGPLSGRLVNRVGARAVMAGSLCGSAAILLALSWIPNEVTGSILVFAWALTGEAFRPACAAVVAEHVAPEDRRNAYAVLRLAVNLGMSIGPAVGGLLAEHSYATVFVVDAATSFAAAASLLLPAGRAIARMRIVEVTQAQLPASRNGTTLAAHLFGVALIAMVAYQALSTMPVYMTQNLSLRDSTYGFVFALSGLIIVLFEVPLTTLLSRWSHRQLLVSGAVLTGFGFGAFAVIGSLAGVIAATFVWTAGEMLLGPATSARVADLEPAHRRGVFVGFHSAVWSAAFALGPWLGMQTFARFGPVVHWLIVGLVGLLAAAVFGSQRPATAKVARVSMGAEA